LDSPAWATTESLVAAPPLVLDRSIGHAKRNVHNTTLRNPRLAFREDFSFQVMPLLVLRL
jgi:hypothetical protein